jgi:hypothetical protein
VVIIGYGHWPIINNTRIAFAAGLKNPIACFKMAG